MGHGTVAKSALQPGDLVFFCDPSRSGGKAASHVGIYIGSNQFIHASSGGGKVQIDSLSKAYYAKYYVGARRLAKLNFYISKRLCQQNWRSFLMFFDSGSFPFPSLSTMR